MLIFTSALLCFMSYLRYEVYKIFFKRNSEEEILSFTISRSCSIFLVDKKDYIFEIACVTNRRCSPISIIHSLTTLTGNLSTAKRG